MSNSASILSFGVELEFLLAYIPESNIADPDPSNPRPVHFTPIPEDVISHKYRNMSSLRDRAISRHIAETLKAAGFPTDPEDPDCGDNKLWEVGFDTSLQIPRHEHYTFHQIEVKTPALDFTEVSLQSVFDVCKLLTDSYRIIINDSCGLHVHVGSRQDGFTLNTIRKVSAFLYAFEPQFETLHPQARQANSFCLGIRSSCGFNTTLRNRTPVTVLEGVAHFLSAPSILSIQYDHGASKFMAYNFTNIHDDKSAAELYRSSTIEFRQHAGTIDPEAIIPWVRTTVGIIQFMRDIEEGPRLMNFFSVCALEKWQRIGTHEDLDNEAKYGPLLCDKAFTIIDLLLRMGLAIPAQYYHKRGVYKHLHRRIRYPPPKLQTPYVGGVRFDPVTGETVDEDPQQSVQSMLLNPIALATGTLGGPSLQGGSHEEKEEETDEQIRSQMGEIFSKWKSNIR